MILMYKYVDNKLVFEYIEIKSEESVLVKEKFETPLYTYFPQKDHVDSKDMIWCPICAEDTEIKYPVKMYLKYYVSYVILN